MLHTDLMLFTRKTCGFCFDIKAIFTNFATEKILTIMQYIAHYDSPLGRMTMASDGKALTGLWFDEQKHYADTLDAENEEHDLAVFAQTQRWLDCYFCGQCPDFMPPLRMIGNDFRKAVWQILLTIPYGKTLTYGEIAKMIAAKLHRKNMSAQAIGGAVGHNPISIIVPCHRVMGAKGKLTGYAGGIERKLWLLKKEKAIAL